jgi:hypothetical protein
MLGSKHTGCFLVVLVRGPELPQLYLTALRNGGLRSQAAEDQLSGRIDPVRRQGADHLAPYALLELIKIRWRLRTPCAGNQYGTTASAAGDLLRPRGMGIPLRAGLTGHIKEPLGMPS